MIKSTTNVAASRGALSVPTSSPSVVVPAVWPQANNLQNRVESSRLPRHVRIVPAPAAARPICVSTPTRSVSPSSSPCSLLALAHVPIVCRCEVHRSSALGYEAGVLASENVLNPPLDMPFNFINGGVYLSDKTLDSLVRVAPMSVQLNRVLDQQMPQFNQNFKQSLKVTCWAPSRQHLHLFFAAGSI